LFTPNNAGAGGQGTVEFLARVDFKRVVPSPVRGRARSGYGAVHQKVPRQSAKKLSASFARDSQTCHGSKNKILAQDRRRNFLTRIAQILQRSPGKNSPSVSTESAAAPAAASDLPSSAAIKWIANDSPRRCEAGFSSENDIDRVVRKRRGKIADRRRGFYAIFKSGLWQHLLAVIHFRAARFQDAVKDGFPCWRGAFHGG